MSSLPAASARLARVELPVLERPEIAPQLPASRTAATAGHQIHLDEWVNSPVSPNSAIELPRG